MKTKVIFKNYIASFIFLLIRIILNFILIRITLYNYGSHINGYNSAVLSLFSYIDVIEGGLGAASQYAMYKPFANNNHMKINSVMKYTNQLFRKIANYILVFTILMSVVYPYLISDFHNKILGSIIVIIYGVMIYVRYVSIGANVLLMNADQKLYVVNGISACTHFLAYTSAIVFAFYKLPYNFVILNLLIGQIIKSILVKFYIKKRYTWLSTDVMPDNEVKKISKDALIQRISTIAFQSTDMILISVFIGVRATSVYMVYSMILSALSKLMDIVSDAPEAIFGNLLVKQDKQTIQRSFLSYELITVIFTSTLISSFLILVKPFVALYTQSVTDTNYLNNNLNILMSCYFILKYYRTTSARIANANGDYSSVKSIYLLEAILNFSLSIILIMFIGLEGVLIASIISLFVSMILIVRHTYRNVIEISISKYFSKCLVNLLLIGINYSIVSNFNILIDSYFDFLKYGFVITMYVFVINIVVNYLFFKKVSKNAIDYTMRAFR